MKSETMIASFRSVMEYISLSYFGDRHAGAQLIGNWEQILLGRGEHGSSELRGPTTHRHIKVPEFESEERVVARHAGERQHL